ncbi:hypothetical protein COJ45_06725 [Bacillus cereus]|nr:hypothetical protein COJ45_06725 [Bacillus cereus]
MEFFLEKWYKDFIKKFDCFVICYFTDAPVTLSELLHNYNSCNKKHFFVLGIIKSLNRWAYGGAPN